MNYPALIAALPAATVAAVSTTPQGIDAVAHVYVSDRPRAATETAEAWWELRETRIVAEEGGHTLIAQVFWLHMTLATGTRANLEVWTDQVRDYFHGKRAPNTTGLISASVTTLDQDYYEREGPALETVLEITFTGHKP